MTLIQRDDGNVHSLSTPHERVMAQALGLGGSDGLMAWAALEKHPATDQAWAWITPCHWAMGREHATLTDPAALGLQEDESRILLAAMQAYFETEGITLHYQAPDRWLAEGEIFRNLPSASLDRVLGRNVDGWLPGASGAGKSPAPASAATSVGARKMRLLQNEMQMLLYTHPVNDQRASRDLPPVNSFWISGSGALPDNFQAAKTPEIHQARELSPAAFADNWAAYTQAWAALDADLGARLLTQQQSGQTLRLSLCGERHALSFETAAPSVWTRLAHLFKPPALLPVLEQL
jgi:hypothetical protein